MTSGNWKVRIREKHITQNVIQTNKQKKADAKLVSGGVWGIGSSCCVICQLSISFLLWDKMSETSTEDDQQFCKNGTNEDGLFLPSLTALV